MNILLTGATGFIGQHLTRTLHLAGHCVCGVTRDANAARAQVPHIGWVALDFSHAQSPVEWLPHLQGIDAVINAAGIFEQHDSATFSAIHTEAPRALFAACAIAGVNRVVQISALGATLTAETQFLRSKAEADQFLLQLPLASMVLQPSLVFGEEGGSSKFFVRLAALPLLILPDGGEQAIQPVHIDDICTAILRYLETVPSFARGRVAAAGPTVLKLREYIQLLRTALGYPRATIIAVRSTVLARLSKWLPLPWIKPDALRMLACGSCADADAFGALLARQPRQVNEFAAEVRAMHRAHRLRDGFIALRYSLALLWLLTGVISLGIYPVVSSAALLSRVGITPFLQLPLLYLAAALDMAFALLIMMFHRSRWVWHAQAVTIIFYSAIIAWKLPEFWIHPYAPMLKNIPLLAAIYLLLQVTQNGSIQKMASHVRTR